MQQPQQPQQGLRSSLLDRYRTLLYAFVAGLVVGMFIGWFFHGLVGTLVWIVTILILLIPLAAAVLFWYSVSTSRSRAPKTRGGDIEASWREIDPTGRDHRR